MPACRCSAASASPSTTQSVALPETKQHKRRSACSAAADLRLSCTPLQEPSDVDQPATTAAGPPAAATQPAATQPPRKKRRRGLLAAMQGPVAAVLPATGAPTGPSQPGTQLQAAADMHQQPQEQQLPAGPSAATAAERAMPAWEVQEVPSGGAGQAGRAAAGMAAGPGGRPAVAAGADLAPAGSEDRAPAGPEVRAGTPYTPANQQSRVMNLLLCLTKLLTPSAACVCCR